jgi:hypothetical protein
MLFLKVVNPLAHTFEEAVTNTIHQRGRHGHAGHDGHFGDSRMRILRTLLWQKS